jgi:hypothetical protein
MLEGDLGLGNGLFPGLGLLGGGLDQGVPAVINRSIRLRGFDRYCSLVGILEEGVLLARRGQSGSVGYNQHLQRSGQVRSVKLTEKRSTVRGRELSGPFPFDKANSSAMRASAISRTPGASTSLSMSARVWGGVSRGRGIGSMDFTTYRARHQGRYPRESRPWTWSGLMIWLGWEGKGIRRYQGRCKQRETSKSPKAFIKIDTKQFSRSLFLFRARFFLVVLSVLGRARRGTCTDLSFVSIHPIQHSISLTHLPWRRSPRLGMSCYAW